MRYPRCQEERRRPGAELAGLAALGRGFATSSTEQPLRILEVGAGIGSMVERLLAGDVLTHATYTAIDNAPVLLTEARRRLPQWADEQGFQVDENPRDSCIFGG